MASPNEDGYAINELLLRSLQQKLEMSRTGSLCNTDPYASIFRVPPHLPRADDDAYEPKIITIGPYHRAKAHAFEQTEHLKLRFLDRLLASTSDQRLEHHIWKMKQMDFEARRCYSERIDMDSDNFAAMLLLDGCFIVSILWAFRNGYRGNKHDLEDESIKEAIPKLRPITHDLLLLENQIPFFVLQEIYHLFIPFHLHPHKPKLDWLAFQYFRGFIPLIKKIPEPNGEQEDYFHLLHVFHSFLLPRPAHPHPRCSSWRMTMVLTKVLGSKYADKEPRSIPTATKLRNAGVKFRDDASLGPSEAKFRNGKIHMLRMEIYDHTGPLLQNLIAFEQCLPTIGMWVTNYACFMDELVDTPEDVALLQREGVIVNYVGSEGEIARLFNELCKKVMFTIEHSHLKSLQSEVNEHYNSNWPRWRAKLTRDYFGNPWTIISLVAAVILLLLTVIQTIFTVLSYVKS